MAMFKVCVCTDYFNSRWLKKRIGRVNRGVYTHWKTRIITFIINRHTNAMITTSKRCCQS